MTLKQSHSGESTKVLIRCHVMSRVIVCNRVIPFSRGRGGCCWSQSQLSLGEGRVHPGQVALTDGNRTSGAIWGSVSCSRALRHAAQFSPGELGFKPATHRSQLQS